MEQELAKYREELAFELDDILRYWMNNTVNEENGGFFGRIDEKNHVHREAPGGVVLYSRILWTFSAAWKCNKNPLYLQMADRAWQYLQAHFRDHDHGGVYWSVDEAGEPLDTRKQVYGQVFCLYGMSEYYQATGREEALAEAVSLFRLVEQHSYDPAGAGYFEAFAADWSPLEDLRLSAKDANMPKTMNTHLHVLEAYANLYPAWPDRQLRDRIAGLLDVFSRHIINRETGHLTLFFDHDWIPVPGPISYGHDIEAAWLLQAAAGIVQDKYRMERMAEFAIRMAVAAAEGLDIDGGLWYEYEGPGRLVKEKHWWPQAEAMVGFFNAWQVTGEEKWLGRSLGSWEFVKGYMKDRERGEWYWGIGPDHTPMPGQDKAGFWKCPYHNGRACLELIRRIDRNTLDLKEK